jgi:aconitase B
MDRISTIEPMSDEIYRYMNFDQMPDYSGPAEGISVSLS